MSRVLELSRALQARVPGRAPQHLAGPTVAAADGVVEQAKHELGGRHLLAAGAPEREPVEDEVHESPDVPSLDVVPELARALRLLDPRTVDGDDLLLALVDALGGTPRSVRTRRTSSR